MNLFGKEHFVFVIVFWLLFDKFPCAFRLCLKSILYACRMLILKNVLDENDLHHVSVMVDHNILIPL